jgi:hypothetical protein
MSAKLSYEDAIQRIQDSIQHEKDGLITKMEAAMSIAKVMEQVDFDNLAKDHFDQMGAVSDARANS